MFSRAIFPVVCLALLAALAPEPAGAAKPTPTPVPTPPSGPGNSRIGSSASSDQAAQVAWNSTDDQFLYVWDTSSTSRCMDNVNAGAIRMRLVSAGTVGVSSPTGGFTTLDGNPDGSGSAGCPMVTYNPLSQQYLVVWSEAVRKSWTYVKAALVNPDGSYINVGRVFSNARYPYVTVNETTGEFLLGYTTLSGHIPTVCRASQSAYDWTCGFTGSYANNYHDDPRAMIAVKPGVAGTGAYLVTWPKGGSNSAIGVAGTLLDTNLQPIAGPGGVVGEFPIDPNIMRSTFAAHQTSSNGDDQFLITWDYDPGNDESRILGRLLSNDPAVCGSGWCFRGSTFQISDSQGTHDVTPQVVQRTTGCPDAAPRCYLVAYSLIGSDNVWKGPFGKIVGFDGTAGPQRSAKFDRSAVVNSPHGGNGIASRNGGESTVCAWSDKRVTSLGRDVYSDWWDSDSAP